MEHIINPVYYQDFILSGKPEFTLRSLKTGNEQIFVVKRGLNLDRRSGHDIYWVNNQLRQMLGHIGIPPETSENVWVFEQKVKDILAGQAAQMKIFSWFWNNVLFLTPVKHLDTYHYKLPDKLKGIQVINHTGRCGHCHRELTHPESIPIGIGPDCFKKLGLTHKTLIT